MRTVIGFLCFILAVFLNPIGKYNICPLNCINNYSTYSPIRHLTCFISFPMLFLMKISGGVVHIFLFAELIWPHKESAVHPLPIQIHNIQHYENLFTKRLETYELEERFFYVGTDKNREYVIGVIVSGYLLPFMAPREDLHNHYGGVKLRINGNIADEIVPIMNRDSLNSVFGEIVGPRNIRPAVLHD